MTGTRSPARLGTGTCVSILRAFRSDEPHPIRLSRHLSTADFVEKEMSEPSRIANNTERSSLELRVLTSPTRVIAGDPNRTFSPPTSTLIVGASDAVLVDALLIGEDVDALGDMIASTGRTLATIFITYGHGEHFFGSDRLIARFPGARSDHPRYRRLYYFPYRGGREVVSSYFGDTVATPTSRPSQLDGDVIDLEGHELRVIEVARAISRRAPCSTSQRSMP